MFSSIAEFFTSNSSVIWSGWGVALVIFIIGLISKTIIFFNTHKIIKKSEYNDLIVAKNNTIDVEQLKSGLEFNLDFGIYIDNETNEKFCPTCLTDKGKKNHLKEETSEYGTTYKCPICPQFFSNEEYEQNVEQARMASEYSL